MCARGIEKRRRGSNKIKREARCERRERRWRERRCEGGASTGEEMAREEHRQGRKWRGRRWREWSIDRRGRGALWAVGAHPEGDGDFLADEGSELGLEIFVNAVRVLAAVELNGPVKQSA